MQVATSAQMREIDRLTIAEYGIGGDILMAFAAKALADVTKEYPGPVHIFCGSGNNGGDGFAAALLLHAAGRSVFCYCFDATTDSTLSDARRFRSSCEMLDLVYPFPDSILTEGVILDCLLGTGCKGELRKEYVHVVEIINRSSIPVIAADIPSGLPSDGYVSESLIAVHATKTITFGVPKRNCVIRPGLEYCGELVIDPLGFPAQLIDRNTNSALFMNDDLPFDLFTSERNNLHKYNRGSVLVIGGSRGYEGAALLTATAALQTGAGIVTIATEKSCQPVLAGKVPEIMVVDHDDIVEFSKWPVCIIGPGLGRDERAVSIARRLHENCDDIKSIIVDADALWITARESLVWNSRIIMTPHAGEASVLLGCKTADIIADRFGAAEEIASRYKCNVVLKGAETISSNGQFSYINTSGNSLLATAGSGDVLSGMIGAVSARISDPLTAAASAVYVHGRCADLALDSGKKSLLAGEITGWLDSV